MNLLRASLLLLVLISLPRALGAQASRIAVLPPEIPWSGESRALAVEKDDLWATPAEAAGFQRTPRYEETVAYLRRLTGASRELTMVSLGKSPEGRDLWMVVASRERAPTPQRLKASGKPVLFAQAGIHAGEIDGKDAGLMFLRDLTVRGTKRRLLEKANFLFVPIFNVDGHERFSPYTRVNQRGPVEAGWRTTARNLNLNRDYAKLDALEMRALVAALNAWDPDLYLDLHVTDGGDYQYDITFGFNGPHAWSPAIGRWLEERLTPSATRGLEAMGHIPGPLIFPVDDTQLEKGLVDWTASPRLSTGYGDARHLPSVIVENHSLKPYAQRVLGTYVLLEGLLDLLGREAEGLRKAIEADRTRRPKEVPLDWKVQAGPASKIQMKAVASRKATSAISGAECVRWMGEPVTLAVPLLRMSEPKARALRPAAYWVPAAYRDVIERLALHGIRIERTSEPREIEVEMYRLSGAQLAKEPFEGRVSVTAAASAEKRRERFPAGSARISTDQPLGDLAMLLLEPASPDSFFQWGFFLEPLQRTEYAESYIMEPMAERMLAEDPALREAFEKKLRDDPKFAGDPRERLQWFYRRTPFFDERWNLYPVARE